jgi:hypothetical protein
MSTDEIRSSLSRNGSEQATAKACGWHRSLRLLREKERKLELTLQEAVEDESLKQQLENCF